MKITARQYISNSKDGNSYTTVFKHYYNNADKKVNKQGDIYSLISISADRKVNVERVSKFVWDSIVDGYLYSTSPTTNESLKDSIADGVRKVKDLMENDKELGEIGINVSFAIVLVKEEGTYVGVFGENDVYTFKKGTLVNISEILKEKRANTAGISLGENDILMVSSYGLLEKSLSRLSTLHKKEDFVKTLDAVGENLRETKALLYFCEDLGISEKIKEKSKLLSNIGGVKLRVENYLKPVARVEKIKKPKDQKVLINLKNRINFDGVFYRIKTNFSLFWQKVSPGLNRIEEIFEEKVGLLGEKLGESFGKKRWYKRIAAKMSEINVQRRKPTGVTGMRIDDYKVKDLRGKRFKILFVFLLITGLLVLGVNYTIKARQAREVSDMANESFDQIEELLSKSQEYMGGDRTSAETYLFQAEGLLEEVPTGLNEKDSTKLEDLRNSVLSIGDSLYKRVGVLDNDGKLSNFLDGRLAFGEGSDVVDLGIYQDNSGNEYLIVGDKGRKSIYRVSLYDKGVKALPDNDGLITEPEQVYVGVSGVYVYDTQEGMLKASFDEQGWFTAFSPLSGLGAGDVKVEDVIEMTVWTTADNVYFLSRDRNALLKSTPAYGDRYGLAYSYLENENISIATDMVADLSIYLTLSEEPSLVRFNYSFYENKYNEAPLGVLGFDGNYGNLTKAFTGDSLDHSLYLFDSEGKRFLRFEKPIESGSDARHPNEISLLAQYVYRGETDSAWDDVRNFVVDLKEDNMYILDGAVIWKLGL